MNPFTTIVNCLKKKDNGPTEAGKQWTEGYNAFQRGKQHYLPGGETHSVVSRIQNALDCFDYSIASGFEDGGIYGTRGSCLQLLELHLDAIDDFNKAIPLEPEDCNLYYMRSVSKGATGDLHGRVADLKEAIRLSRIDNDVNKSFNLGAKKLGYESSAAMFKAELLGANLDLEQQEDDERMRSKCSGVDLGPDLVTRRRAGARRRTRSG
jgi:tetratricopeptide (TPR) repeat protein